MNFLCAVSGRFPENYEIGVRANRWGVEEKYEEKIRRTSVGDSLVFMVGGAFRSIHRIESEVFYDDSLLWPEKDGSRFPWRVRISDPLYHGKVPVASLASRISFMRGKKRWQGTVQGAHGVFNARLTGEDMELLREKLKPVRKPTLSLKRQEKETAPSLPLHIFEGQLRRALNGLLTDLGLELVAGRETPSPEAGTGRAAFTLLARRPESRKSVVLALDTGAKASDLLLHVLREMSALRSEPAGRNGVEGLILSASPREELWPVVAEISNLSLRHYEVSFHLDPEPDAMENGPQVA